MTVNIAQDRPGQIELTFLTGQGRSSTRAEGDMQATITVPFFTDNAGRTVNPGLGDPPQLQLNSYQNLIRRINVDMNIREAETGQLLNSRLFENFELTISQLRFEQDGTTFTANQVQGLPQTFRSRIRVFPGRYTSFPVFLNDSQFRTEVPTAPEEPTATFLPEVFGEDNQLGDTNNTNVLMGFLSDLLQFDISGIPEGERPPLSNGQPAGRVYLSGDTYGISQGGSRGLFESLSLTLGQTVEGRFAPPGEIGVNPPPGLPQGTTPGTYSLIQPDPTDPDPFSGSRITALQGIWRDYRKMINNVGSTVAITMPSSRDDDTQDIVIFRQSGGANGTIQSMFFGSIDMGNGTVRVYPIKNLVSASVEGERQGRVTSMVTGTGASTLSAAATRRGTIEFASGETPAGFPSRMDFVVYRR